MTNTIKIPHDWSFSADGIAAGFEQHVREQLPWYDLATGAVAHIARHYIPNDGRMYDIGASTGNIARALADTLINRDVEFIAIDDCHEMVKQYDAYGTCVHADATQFKYRPADVSICFLVLMFIQPSERLKFLQKLVSNTRSGGAVIVLDKVASNAGYMSTVLHRLTIAGKVSTGCNPADIISKELSLSGVQRPLPSDFITLNFPEAVEFFRFGEFAGWVIESRE